MASAFAHALAAVSLGAAITRGRRLPRVLTIGAVCSVLPDVDVLGFAVGVRYGDLLGHRGLTHSLLFAALLAPCVSAICFRDEAWRGLRLRIGVYLFAVTSSHGLFDAMTNGGLGVAFFSPWDTTRYFLPFRPVLVSPIGVQSFFTRRSIELLWTELVWILLPSLAVAALVYLWARWRDREATETPSE